MDVGTMLLREHCRMVDSANERRSSMIVRERPKERIDHLVSERVIAPPKVRIKRIAPKGVSWLRTVLLAQQAAKEPARPKMGVLITKPKSPAMRDTTPPQAWAPEPRFVRWFPGATPEQCTPVY